MAEVEPEGLGKAGPARSQGRSQGCGHFQSLVGQGPGSTGAFGSARRVFPKFRGSETPALLGIQGQQQVCEGL